MTQVATISTTNWIITIVALLVIIGLDFAWAVARREKDPSMREATAWSVFYVSLAVAFGLFLSQWLTSREQQEFFAGWLTEYSLSFDNLFVFVLILTRLKIDKQKQQLALLIGLLIAPGLEAIHNRITGTWNDRFTLRPRFDPRDLWIDGKCIYCDYGQYFCTHGTSPALLPHRRAHESPRLHWKRTLSYSGLHRI